MSGTSDDTPRATLAEVARTAGVSVSTVSKVLNGRPGVSAETRTEIEELLDRRHYNRRNSPRPIAPLIDILCYEVDSAWAVEAISGVERIARQQAMGVVVSGTNDRHAADPAWLEGVLNRNPLGVISLISTLPTEQIKQLRARNIPLVTMDAGDSPDSSGRGDVPSIGSADFSGGYAATKHLLDLGHRTIGMITGPSDLMVSTARVAGFRAAVETAGLSVDPDLIRPGEFHHADGLAQGHLLLTRENRPTAIFAGSDVQALGVYEAARALRIGIPDQLSVVGYDDLPLAPWTAPPLTTIRVPLAEMSKEATRLLRALRDDPNLTVPRIEVATSLVVRESTASIDLDP
ncbi:LacI family DNA-binding transcriptional regulator [Microlunatus soli]|uniref:Transcriptional regulator, LacI family n=1 Tax=Microlunatus soli TaxID=630515 RepID=A0A1H1T6F6_9ACTN|nr:substrate-binding domain-containing protein [Microlunatus soli]SDS55768.1 transcriptional regulator, LacI family [Microlunatus soli]